GRNRNRASEAEELLRQSLQIRKAARDSDGEAQVLHTLGQLIGRNRNRASEAEELLRQSMELGVQLNKDTHMAQVLYTWGKLRARSNREEGIQLLHRSLDLNRKIHHSSGVEIVRRELRRMGEDVE
ncbi:tetratricopeptide repeat protein, partial [Actinoplanes sp. NPDC051633]|uniref:tetratricopeptide repeat protein n=1 Tax=Actinoplanes sp. NPDC051633 TaxID=3155670 RepID=UPI003435B9E6